MTRLIRWIQARFRLNLDAVCEMSKGKAARLRKEDRKIRQEERRMASRHGGHITKLEQKRLNRQENKVSAQIGK